LSILAIYDFSVRNLVPDLTIEIMYFRKEAFLKTKEERKQ